MRRLQQVLAAIQWRRSDYPVVVVLSRLDRDILVSDSLASQYMTVAPATIDGVPFVSHPYVRQSYLVYETASGPHIEML